MKLILIISFLFVSVLSFANLSPYKFAKNSVNNSAVFESQKLKATVLSEKDAEEVFEYLSKQDYIPYEYPNDGCYARAQEMSILMLRLGINSVKIFSMGNLKADTQNTTTGYVEWDWHVAPVVLVQQYNREVPMVIDPSLFKHPVEINTWVTVQTKDQDTAIDNLLISEIYQYAPPVKGRIDSDWTQFFLDNAYKVMIRYQKLAIKNMALKEHQLSLVPHWKEADIKKIEQDLEAIRNN